VRRTGREIAKLNSVTKNFSKTNPDHAAPEQKQNNP